MSRSRADEPTGPFLGHDSLAYTALAAHWDGGYDVFIFHADIGLIGQTRSDSRWGVEPAARAYIEVERGHPRGARIRVIAE